MKKNTKKYVIIFVIMLAMAIHVEIESVQKAYVVSKEEYTITNVKSYIVSRPRIKELYQVEIEYEKDGKVYKSYSDDVIDKEEYDVINKYFHEGNQEAARNYIGDIKVYKNYEFKILNEEINDDN